MRFRKAKGKKKAIVTLTEAEIVEACFEYLCQQNVENVGSVCWLKVDMAEKRRGDRVQFVCELTKNHEPKQGT